MKCPEPYAPQDIIENCKKGGGVLEQMINKIMKTLLACKAFTTGVVNFVKYRGGSVVDGEDILMEGLVQTATNLETQRYQATSNITYYAFGVCKYKWFNQVRKKGLDTVEMDDGIRQIKDMDYQEEWMIQDEAKQILWDFVDQQSGHCPKYLRFWAFGFQTAEIAKEMEINEDNVRKKTSKCRKRLVEWLRKHPKKEVLLKGLMLD